MSVSNQTWHHRPPPRDLGAAAISNENSGGRTQSIGAVDKFTSVCQRIGEAWLSRICPGLRPLASQKLSLPHFGTYTHTHRQASASPSPNSFHGIGHCRGMVEDLLKRSIKQYCSGRITVIFIAVFDFFFAEASRVMVEHTLFRGPTHQICLPCCSLW